MNVTLSTGEQLELRWSEVVRQPEPLFIERFPFFSVDELAAGAEELQRTDPNDFIRHRLQRAIWEVPEVSQGTTLRVAENTGAECIASFCPSLDFDDSKISSAAASVSSLIDAAGTNMVARIAHGTTCPVDSESTALATSDRSYSFPGQTDKWDEHLSHKRPTRIFSRVSWFTKRIRDLFDLGVELNLGYVVPGVRRVQLHSADVFFTTSTAPTSISSGWHTDSYDVLLLMMQGSKRFRVAGRAAGGAQLFDLQLRPGNAIFIPAGFFHMGGSSSLSLDSTMLSVSTTTEYLPPSLRFDDIVKAELSNTTITFEDVIENCFYSSEARTREAHASSSPSRTEYQCRDWAWAASEAGIMKLRAMGVADRLRV